MLTVTGKSAYKILTPQVHTKFKMEHKTKLTTEENLCDPKAEDFFEMNQGNPSVNISI